MFKAKSDEEATMKAKRAETVIRRMDENERFLADQRAANEAKGIKPCKEGGPWGSNTGLLSSEVCSRTRDGFIDQGQRTGAFLFF